MASRALQAVMYTPTASGGHSRYTWELLSALSDAAPPSELRLTLLTSRDLDAEFRTTRWRIADVLPPLRDKRTFANRAQWAASRTLHYARREEAVLRWVRAQERVDILHYQEPPFASPLHLRRARAAGVRPVATVHNVRPHGYHVPAARWLTDLTTRMGWMQYATLFVHSRRLGDEVARELGPRTPPVVAIPHGVWTGHAAPAAPPDRDGYLLLFGVMRRNKGLHLALDALRLLPGRRLVLAGAFEDAAFAREIRRRIEAERLPVTLIDRLVPEADVPGVFAGAALALLPYTEFHAQSGVLHLAIAFGVPAVVTDVGAMGEEVRREGIGTVAAAARAPELARAVLEALEPPLHDAARARCLALARTLTWSAAARLTLEAYTRLSSGEAR